MTPNQSVGRVMTPVQAEEFYTRCMDAEKAMGPLSREERLIILNSLGNDITLEELRELVAGKRILIVRGKEQC